MAREAVGAVAGDGSARSGGDRLDTEVSQKMSRSGKKYVDVWPGCRVEWQHCCGDRSPHVVRVIDVRERLAKINKGTTWQAPLVSGIDEVTSEEVSFDASLITRMIEIAPYQPTERRCNSFDEFPVAPEMVLTQRKNIWCGPLEMLARRVLQGMGRVDLPRPINDIRLHKMFFRVMPGFLKSDGYKVWVRRRPFQEWVRRNARRIIRTKAEQIVKATAIQKDWELEEELAIEEELRRDSEAVSLGPFDDYDEHEAMYY